jgi:hypothetical protein
MSQDDSTVTPTKTSKVKRNYQYTDTAPEITLEPVHLDPEPESTRVSVTPAVTVTTGISHVDALLHEFTTVPAKAIDFIKALGKITKGWEPIGSNGNPVNEIPVPPGKNPRDFVRTASSIVHISGFRLTTIFGEEVALITKDSPKWRVVIQGEYQVDTPFVEHSQKAEVNVKNFAETKLRERGFIIGQ